MPPIAYVNPVGKKPKKTKSLKRKNTAPKKKKNKKRNPLAAAFVANPAKPNTRLTMKTRKKRRANPKRKKSSKRKNAWPGDSTRHMLAKKTGAAGGPYKSKWGRKKYGNPKKKTKKRRNPAGDPMMEIVKSLGFSVAAFAVNKFAGATAEKMFDKAVTDPASGMAKFRPFVRPVVEAILPAATLMFGKKLLKGDGVSVNSIFVGSSLAAIHDATKLLPETIKGYLADAMGEGEMLYIPDDVYGRAISNAQIPQLPNFADVMVPVADTIAIGDSMVLAGLNPEAGG
jgi:hypothetical protein